MSKPLTKREVNRVMKEVQRTGKVPPGYSVNFRADPPVTRVADVLPNGDDAGPGGEGEGEDQEQTGDITA